MPGGLQVDIEGLRSLARALVGIRQDLGDLGADIGRYDGVLGAQAVKQELSKVAGNWKQARQRMSDELEALARMADGAATQYATAEAELSRAFLRDKPGPAAGRSDG